MAKDPKTALPDLSTSEGMARYKTTTKSAPYFKSAWKYEGEPRVFFTVRAYRTPTHPYGIKTVVGVPESLVGKPKLEKRWIEYELGGHMVKLKHWRQFIIPDLKRKRLLY